jgi:putative hemolysin
MTFRGKIQTALATAVIGAAPLAMASGAVAHPSSTHTTPSQAKAYGKYCAAAGASKKHVKGQKGTPFSDCVTALAHAAKTKPAPTTATAAKMTAEKTCKAAGESRKHVKGEKGTPFSQCVTAGTKMLAAARRSS